MHSPLMTVLNRLGNTYQAYSNTYKTYMLWLPTMGAQDNPWIGMLPQLERILMSTFHMINTMNTQDDFKNIEQENHTNLAALKMELDDLHHRVQAGEGQHPPRP